MFKQPTKRNFMPLLGATLLAGGSAFAASSDDDLTGLEAFFDQAQVVSGPDVVDCTLSGGTQTHCFSITVKPSPTNYTPGPWCPTDIKDGADAGGIWFLDGETVDVDGEFISKLAETYGDTNWQLFDKDTGKVRYTGTLEACEAAARPDVDPDYQNYCVQCLPEYLPEDATTTYLIPIKPIPAERPTPTNFAGSGIAFNGVRLDGPAPLDAILGAYTVAPFDDCGGHVNTHVGYHYHAVTDCLSDAPAATQANETDDAEAHGGQIGIAMDGFAIFEHLLADGSAPEELDTCNGHTTENGAYHYHAGTAGSNLILGCLTAEPGCVARDGSTSCEMDARPPRPE
jgi:hypothetical protein